jgi:hypothetical protein
MDVPDELQLSLLSRLSITKWIHLHGEDGGLLEFFHRVYRLLRPGGILVLEPQEWEGYKSAKRMDRVSGCPRFFQIFRAERSRLVTETRRKCKAPQAETKRVWRGTNGDWIRTRRVVWYSRRRRHVCNSPLSCLLNIDHEAGFKRPLYTYRKPS